MDVSSLKIDEPFVNMITNINFLFYVQFRSFLTLSDEKSEKVGKDFFFQFLVFRAMPYLGSHTKIKKTVR